MFANEVWIILFARTLQGFGRGFVMVVQPIYICEISTVNIRGATGSLIQFFTVSKYFLRFWYSNSLIHRFKFSAGVLYVYAIGPYVSYQVLQWFCLAVPIIFIAGFIFMPESPYYYVAKGQRENASKSLQFLHQQTPEAVKAHLEDIENFVLATAQQKGTLKDLFKIPSNRKAFMIVSLLFVFQQLTGNMTVLNYIETIFEAAHTNIDAAVSAIIVGVVQVFASCSTPFIADRLGRKPILLICSIIMGVALFVLGGYFYMEIASEDISHIMWLPLASLILYMVAFNAGFGGLSWVILGEIFSANIKSLAASLATSLCFLTIFLVTYIYPYLNSLGTYYTFWLFGISCVFDFFFILFIVFETKGLSLQDIQNKLNNKEVVDCSKI